MDAKKTALIAKLTRLASEETDAAKKAKLESLLATAKKAVNNETKDFVRWVISTQTPMSTTEVASFVNRTLGIKTAPKATRRQGPRFRVGDSVLIRAEKHVLRGFDKGNYDRFDGKVGTVKEIVGSGLDCMVVFKGEPAPVLFEGAMQSQGVGIFKYTKPYTIEGSAKIEMIYFAGNRPTEDQKFVVETYVSRSRRTEKRSANYYTGHVVFAAVGDKGWYFRGFPQQRMQVNPNSEGGYQARTFNPRIGDVYYIGVMGKRPSNWQDQLEKLDALMAQGGSPGVTEVSDEMTDAEVEEALNMKKDFE